MSARKHCLKLLLSCLSMLCGVVVPAPAAPQYSPRYAPTFLPADFTAAALNNAGQVVGTAGGGAATWSPASVLSYGVLLPGSEGLGINDRGDIVGTYRDQAFVFAADALTIIPARADHSAATSINDAGAVAGRLASSFIDGPTTGFYYAQGSVAQVDDGFPFDGGNDVANAVNNAGTLVGTLNDADATDDDWSDRNRQAYTWRNGTLRTWGTLGGSISEGLDINDAGTLAGWSTNADGSAELAFLASDTLGMIDLGSLGGSSTRALALNNLGWAVGLSDVGGGSGNGGGYDYHAFLYAQHGIVDLNALVDPLGDWLLVSAADINDAGQILARACNGVTDECRAVRLDLIPAMPEPAPGAMLAAGVVLGAALLRRGPRRRPSSRHAWGGLALLALAVLTVPPAATAQPTVTPAFTMTAVPRGFDAQAINNLGHVVGSYGDAAAVWDGNAVATIVALAPGSTGRGITDGGVIVGTWNGNAFIRTAAGVANLGRYGSWAGSEGIAVNARGDVAGNGAWGPGERGRGWVLSLGVLRVIPSFNGEFSYVEAINRFGQVVGTAQKQTERSPYDRRGFIYKDRVLTDIGAIGDGVNSEAFDINDAGQVVGGAEYVYDPFGSGYHPFLYQNGIMRDLGTLGGSYGVAQGINNAGAVVGGALLAGDEAQHAFLYEDGVLRDLHALTALPPGWTLVGARDINDRRQILAQACAAEDCTMVRLDPVAPSAAPAVPAAGR
ncbi:HAF repeat/PEP-CTERM domain-containing protein [Massilia sp. YIM B02763]|uniref:HAF repeat/PEP-CTERM domain-containing protein n=1 Tax=Massilia sp. YIM B02763 TaxID=3050130 RepID=UPI0025B6A87B|nr:HAF repeat/PEP-CTERM domain-containing protein [Massilia sp. YIM B02763]MDN4053052.1 HAF repeat/PEP-CTERM domain-containing protein [Massilia sp. YIM B02763]